MMSTTEIIKFAPSKTEVSFANFANGSFSCSNVRLHSIINLLRIPHKCDIEVVEHQCKMSRRCCKQEAVCNPNNPVRYLISFDENYNRDDE